ncbi:unnamed protein product, partial [Effrenium voratum]
DEGSESSFQLSVLPELSAADLSCCVRDRLGLVPSVPFYLTEESRKTGPALPLSPALPDGSRLRLVLPMGKSPFPAPGVAPAAPASAGGTAPAAAAADTQNCCGRLRATPNEEFGDRDVCFGGKPLEGKPRGSQEEAAVLWAPVLI